MPAHASSSNGGPPISSSARNHHVNNSFDHYYPNGMPYRPAMPPMQMPPMQSHEHNLPAHNFPIQHPAQLMSAQHMQRTQQQPNFGQMDSQHATLPPIQALPQSANIPFHPQAAMEFSIGPTPYCFGLGPMGTNAFGTYLQPLGYNDLYSFSGPSGA
jgi:hypothetical protein